MMRLERKALGSIGVPTAILFTGPESGLFTQRF
jgi:hypothetical protein